MRQPQQEKIFKKILKSHILVNSQEDIYAP